MLIFIILTDDPTPVQRCIVSGFFVHAARLHYTGTCYKYNCVYVCVIIIGVFVIAGPLEVTIPFTFTLHQYYMKREAPHGEYVVTMRERMCLC